MLNNTEVKFNFKDIGGSVSMEGINVNEPNTNQKKPNDKTKPKKIDKKDDNKQTNSIPILIYILVGVALVIILRLF